jgi:sigma-E factor negative regulatory protein RseB
MNPPTASGAARWSGVRRQVRRCAIGLAVVAGAVGRTQAAGPSTPNALPAVLDGPTIVKRLQDSARLRNYSGTFVVSSSGSMSSARIVHATDGSNPIERVESLDGQMRRVFRHNEAVHILWPGSRSASIEPGGNVLGFPSSALATDSGSTLEMYEVQPGNDDRIAGHDAQTVTLRPRDNARFLQRWWLERTSGLLLRADVVNDKGEVLESAAFSELQLGSRVQAQTLVNEMNRLDGYRVSRSRIVNTELEREGWSLKTPVPGFRAVQCVLRQSNDSPARSQPGAGAGAAAAAPGASTPVSGATTDAPMLQAIYSDGLTHVSLFIEAYRPGVHQPEPVVAMGATHALARRSGDWWVTVVGDVPPATLRQFALALERRKP